MGGRWIAAIFFFVAGLELKREFVAGDLRDPRRAAIPVVAAVSGVAVPALLYTLINLGGGGDLQGWTIPTATDIAFALAVLAMISTHLPSGLRTFLLTLAVVDDLLAITIIAVFYTSNLSVLPLVLALLPLALFGVLVQRRVRSWYLLLPLAAATWALTVGGLGGLVDSLADRVTIGVVVALVVGKTVGIFGATVLMARFTRAKLDKDLSWTDVLGVSVLAGVRFTVSLLIGELPFGMESDANDHVKVGVLVGSVLAATLAAVVLGRRNKVYRSICQDEERDEDNDGIPDVYLSGR